MAHQLTVQTVPTGQALVLRLTGELIAGTADETVQTVLEATAGLTRPSLLLLDLRDVTLLTAEGVRALRAMARTQASRGVECSVLVSPDSTVATVLNAAVPAGALPRFTEFVLERPVPDDRLDPLLVQFESLTRTLLDATTVGAALRQVVAAAQVVVPGADLVSVTLRAADGTFYTPAETDAVAAELDKVQYDSGRGPCVDAAHSTGPGYVASDDLSGEHRWPEFASQAVDHGYGSIISTELLFGSASLSGALNIYCRQPHGLTATDREAALLLATHASLAVAHSHITELADIQQAHLRQAINSRDVIGQAKGILMNRQGISADAAFDLLRRSSQHLNIKLVDVARALTSQQPGSS